MYQGHSYIWRFNFKQCISIRVSWKLSFINIHLNSAKSEICSHRRQVSAPHWESRSAFHDSVSDGKIQMTSLVLIQGGRQGPGFSRPRLENALGLQECGQLSYNGHVIPVLWLNCQCSQFACSHLFLCIFGKHIGGVYRSKFELPDLTWWPMGQLIMSYFSGPKLIILGGQESENFETETLFLPACWSQIWDRNHLNFIDGHQTNWEISLFYQDLTQGNTKMRNTLVQIKSQIQIRIHEFRYKFYIVIVYQACFLSTLKRCLSMIDVETKKLIFFFFRFYVYPGCAGFLCHQIWN